MQLLLPLEPEKGTRANAFGVLWRYSVDHNGVVEWSPGSATRFVYGLWHRVFGCWAVNADSNEVREIIPDWPILAPSGIWRDPQDISCAVRSSAAAQQPRLAPEATAAFAVFGAAIPGGRRRLAAGFGHLQWTVLDLMAQAPDFATFVEDRMMASSSGYIAASLVLAGIQRLSRAERRHVARRMMAAADHELLSELCRRRCDPADVRRLNALSPGTAPLSRARYLALLAASKHRGQAAIQNCS